MSKIKKSKEPFKMTGGTDVLALFLDTLQSQLNLDMMLYGESNVTFEITEHPTNGLMLRFFDPKDEQGEQDGL